MVERIKGKNCVKKEKRKKCARIAPWFLGTLFVFHEIVCLIVGHQFGHTFHFSYKVCPLVLTVRGKYAIISLHKPNWSCYVFWKRI